MNSQLLCHYLFYVILSGRCQLTGGRNYELSPQGEMPQSGRGVFCLTIKQHPCSPPAFAVRQAQGDNKLRTANRSLKFYFVHLSAVFINSELKNMTSKVIYQGGLRTQATHLRSGNTIITDAPVDNKGKGEAFSPTDLVATALASCMLTIMGIKADDMNVNIEGTTAEVEKIMGAEPRKIGRASCRERV